MITIEIALSVHKLLINTFGGSHGVREINLLKSAIERPYSGYEDKEFYPTAIEKSASIIESVVKNHPFIDGNKRTGYVLMRLLLLEEDLDIESSQSDKYDFVVSIAKGDMTIDQIKAWIKEHIKFASR